MRNFVLTLLLAGTAISPALAERPGRDDSSSSREDRQVERSESHQDRSEPRSESRSERSQQVERHVDRSNANFGGRDRSVDAGQSAQVQAHRAQVQERVRATSSDDTQANSAEIEARRAQVRERVRDRSVDSDAAQPNVNERGRPVLQPGSNSGNENDSVANWRGRDRRDVAQPTVGDRTDRGHVRVRVPEGARPDRPAPLPETADRRGRHGDNHWRTDWRNNNHYDWRNHRRHHRSLFHLGFYFDPFGWNYHRYNVGWRLWPSYYSSNYWLNDPYQYRLPYAPYPYRWIRYYNDALLVDTFTGQVVDVIYDFFW